MSSKKIVGVATDIDRTGVEHILAKNPFLGEDITHTLRLNDRSTADAGERLYRLFITSLVGRRGGKIPLHNLASTQGPCTFLSIKNNTFEDPVLETSVESTLGAAVPPGLTFSTVDDLRSLAGDNPGMLICPGNDSIVPGLDAVVFQDGVLYLIQLNYYHARPISIEALRFMWDATHNTRYYPSRACPWVVVVGHVDDLDERSFPSLLPCPESTTWEDVTLHAFLESCLVTCALRLNKVRLQSPGSQLCDVIYDTWGVPYESTLPKPPGFKDPTPSGWGEWYQEDVWPPRISPREREAQHSEHVDYCRALSRGIWNEEVAAKARKWFKAVEADMAALGGTPSKLVTCFI